MSTSIPPSSMARPEPTDTNAGTSYQMRQQSFSSNSGSGYTVWYFGKSNSSILMPPTIPQARLDIFMFILTLLGMYFYTGCSAQPINGSTFRRGRSPLSNMIEFLLFVPMENQAGLPVHRQPPQKRGRRKRFERDRCKGDDSQ